MLLNTILFKMFVTSHLLDLEEQRQAIYVSTPDYRHLYLKKWLLDDDGTNGKDYKSFAGGCSRSLGCGIASVLSCC